MKVYNSTHPHADMSTIWHRCCRRCRCCFHSHCGRRRSRIEHTTTTIKTWVLRYELHKKIRHQHCRVVAYAVVGVDALLSANRRMDYASTPLLWESLPKLLANDFDVVESTGRTSAPWTPSLELQFHIPHPFRGIQRSCPTPLSSLPSSWSRYGRTSISHLR